MGLSLKQRHAQRSERGRVEYLACTIGALREKGRFYLGAVSFRVPGLLL